MLFIWATNKDINNAFVEFDNEVVTVLTIILHQKSKGIFQNKHRVCRNPSGIFLRGSW